MKHQWLDKHYGGIKKSTLIAWYAKFKRGRTNTDDAERSCHPKSVVVSEHIKKIHNMVLTHRKLKMRDIADILKISEGSVFTILHENLSKCKLLSKWVFERNKKNFLRRHVIMDETWIRYYMPESKRSSAACESRPK